MVYCIVYRNKSAYDGIHYLLVVLAYFGFMFFDLLFIAVTINYCSQCQLLTFYIDNIQDKVRNKKYDNLHIAIKVRTILELKVHLISLVIALQCFESSLQLEWTLIVLLVLYSIA